jgi:hypothetical protein
MQCTTGLTDRQRRLGTVAHTIAVIGLVVLAATGTPLESIGGWLGGSALVAMCGGKGQAGSRQSRFECKYAWRGGWTWLRRSWVVAAARSEILMLVVFVNDRQEWEWVCLLPWVAWVWTGMGGVWPRLGRQPLYAGMGRMWELAALVADNFGEDA